MTDLWRKGTWRWRIREYLADGYGVEDIAIFMKCDADQVRAEVQMLRDVGLLNSV